MNAVPTAAELEFETVRIAATRIFESWRVSKLLTYSAADRLPLLGVLCSPQMFAYLRHTNQIDADGRVRGSDAVFTADPTLTPTHVVLSPMVFHVLLSLISLISLHDRAEAAS